MPAAGPGDTILVPPGTYRESVLIDKSDLTLRGSRGAEIDAHGFTNGIRVGTGEETPGPDGFPVCPPLALRNVIVEGLTVRNAEDNGIFLIGIDGFQVRGGRYVDDHEYGVFPRCSTHGAIEGNLAEGANDTGIYVGNDTNLTVSGNRRGQHQRLRGGELQRHGGWWQPGERQHRRDLGVRAAGPAGDHDRPRAGRGQRRDGRQPAGPGPTRR